MRSRPMVDRLKLDPARIARLKDPKRLETVDPERIWQVVPTCPTGVIADIGTGAGYLALPFAARLPGATIHACDVLAGMLDLVHESAQAQSLDNLECVLMAETDTGLPNCSVDLVTMVQVHHELDDPEAVLGECRRILKSSGHLAIVDWKHPDEGGPGGATGRRVAAIDIHTQLQRTSFTDVRSHPTYPLHNLITARPETNQTS